MISHRDKPLTGGAVDVVVTQLTVTDFRSRLVTSPCVVLTTIPANRIRIRRK